MPNLISIRAIQKTAREKLSALAQPSCPYRHTINSKNPMIFAQKSADVHIWRIPSPLSGLDKPSPRDCWCLMDGP